MSDYAMFYNSENGDRVYDADSFSNWLKKFFTTGVFEGDCQVTALGDMVVNLAPGYANIMGKVKELENQTFTLEPADGSYPRIDTIVIERNDTDRDITAKLITGELSGNDPVPTARVWENGVYQLIVAEVYVAAGATEVTQADITDKRSDPDVCGIVAGTVTEMDFSQFTAQFESYFEQFKASNLEEFDEWFQHMKDQLDTDAAGHLQNEIDAINTNLGGRVTTLENNLSGFKFYPTGTELVALVSDDSYYTDANDNYILASSPTGQSMIDNITYKALASEEDTRGMEGEDTAKGFGGGKNMTYKRTLTNTGNGTNNISLTPTLLTGKHILVITACNVGNRNTTSCTINITGATYRELDNEFYQAVGSTSSDVSSVANRTLVAEFELQNDTQITIQMGGQSTWPCSCLVVSEFSE